jgi:DNA replication protein DnaC
VLHYVLDVAVSNPNLKIACFIPLDLLEIIEDRHAQSTTVITSQYPTKEWHHLIGEPTIADAICDRLLHHCYKIELKGESIRKTKNK